MSQLVGIAKVKMNGGTLRSKSEDGTSFQPGGQVRESRMSVAGNDFIERVMPGKITTTLQYVAETDVDALRKLRNGTVEYETDIGVIWILPNAFVTELGELSGGELEVTFEGDPAKRA